MSILNSNTVIIIEISNSLEMVSVSKHWNPETIPPTETVSNTWC